MQNAVELISDWDLPIDYEVLHVQYLTLFLPESPATILSDLHLLSKVVLQLLLISNINTVAAKI